jgi:tetratricopeptide (TPR) repeat protein
MRKVLRLSFCILFIPFAAKAQVTNILSADTAFARKFKIDEYFNMDLSMEDRQHYKEEIEKLSLYIDKTPPDCSALVNRGAYFSYLGFYVNAIKDYDAALNLNPNIPEALYNRGIAKSRFLYTYDGCKDIFKAGELGLAQGVSSFQNNCKRYTALMVKN